jgi:hypothetical protein
MNAVAPFRSLRQQVIDDARYANGIAHLEAPEVPRWIEAMDDHDIVGALSEALSDEEGKRHARLCALLSELCEKGEDIPRRLESELVDILRASLTDYCVGQAQRIVDMELL